MQRGRRPPRWALVLLRIAARSGRRRPASGAAAAPRIFLGRQLGVGKRREDKIQGSLFRGWKREDGGSEEKPLERQGRDTRFVGGVAEGVACSFCLLFFQGATDLDRAERGLDGQRAGRGQRGEL
jgi:hypothetical protein